MMTQNEHDKNVASSIQDILYISFMELQLTALSALAPTQGRHKLIGVDLNRNYTKNHLT